MKKFAFFLAPLMAISFLTNCNNTPKQYMVNVGEHEHLSFFTIDGKDLNNTKATAEQDFKFKMNVNSNDYFYVPTSLDIKINDMPSLVSDYYHITPSEDRKSAEVSIDASKVVGNILISGSAVDFSKYNYVVSTYYGLDVSPNSKGSANKDSDLIITFTPKETYAKPKAENILIEFDDVESEKKWVSPAAKDVDEFCSFNEENGQLTIKSKHIKNNIDIIARASDYPLLEQLSWEEIEKYSSSGWAPYLFYIGKDSKTVRLFNVEQRVRIIDFNKDYIDPKQPEKSKVGITFEFDNVICDSNGCLIGPWDNSGENYDFPNSHLNNFINNNLFNDFPEDLKKVIKKVNKKVNVSHDGGTTYNLEDYLTKVFILSKEEISTDGEKYKYYVENPDEAYRAKRDLEGVLHNYFLRSPVINEYDKVDSINDIGELVAFEADDDYSSAPAFCI